MPADLRVADDPAEPWWCECSDARTPHVHCPPWDGRPTLRLVDPRTGREISADAD